MKNLIVHLKGYMLCLVHIVPGTPQFKLNDISPKIYKNKLFE